MKFALDFVSSYRRFKFGNTWILRLFSKTYLLGLSSPLGRSLSFSFIQTSKICPRDSLDGTNIDNTDRWAYKLQLEYANWQGTSVIAFLYIPYIITRKSIFCGIQYNDLEHNHPYNYSNLTKPITHACIFGHTLHWFSFWNILIHESFLAKIVYISERRNER